ncbi:MAG: phosphoenolpyruvate--protein phosphotransferase [Alphaproteobacteria bacterium]
MSAAQGFDAPGHGGQGISPSRRLLARLRDVMAASGGAQARLDKIVRLIAAEMVAEVCSCYVMRPGEVLELFSTIGLNPAAVHRTRLRVGEGLVGEVAATARSLAIANAPSHPSFAYRPETGEEAFHSLLGVPLLRGGRVRGVLVIQNRQRRNYTEEEVETLQTIAMVVAELVASGELGAREELAGDSGGEVLPSRIAGLKLNDGLAQGLAVLHRPQLTVREMVAEDPVAEAARLRTAVEAMHSSLDALLAATAASRIAESIDILETYRMFAEDRGWLNRINEAINTGLTAEAAVQRVQNDMRARMAHMTDPYIRERLMDFDDLANRLLLHLAGKTSAAAAGTLPDDVVLVARSIGPAELLDYDQRRLRALVLEEGSAASHVAIVARALDIPMVGQCRDLLSLIEPMDPVLVDGDNGQIFVRPAEDVRSVFTDNVRLRDRRRLEYAELAGLPATTRDGVEVSLNINAGLLVDLPHLHAMGADGVGLYRTEIPFMVRSAYPDVAAQTALYARVLDQAAGKPVVFRTLDAGGDKQLPYFNDQAQNNPALGWRAIRIGLDRPAMLRMQLRAVLRAARGRPVDVMFPMVAEVAEFDAARRLLDMELERAAADGYALPKALRVGVMVEVPALLWQLPALLSRADFVSVGSNDLMQYLFAADRGNPKLAQRYDPLSPPLLDIMKDLAERCTDAGVPISVCGEMAGRPLEAMALVGLGMRNLSMAPTAIGAVKAMIRSLKVAPLSDYLDLMRAGTRSSLRESLRAFARDHGVRI